FLLILVVGGLLFNYLRPLPQANASITNISTNINSIKLTWPSRGYAALGAKGFGTLETHGSQSARPMASIAKVVTALAILEKYPIKQGQLGPTITITQQDVDIFNKYFGMGGAYVRVEKGEEITLYQALQAILLPSANNMADSLAIWAFGSMDAYHGYANALLKRSGLKRTTVAIDASGFSPASTSTPSDLIRLGELALSNTVIAEIVAQKSASIPVHGVVYSANSRLGYNSVIGIKTGLTDQAGGCFLFAANHEVAKGKSVTIIGVIMGTPTLRSALDESEPLLNSAKPHFSLKTPIKSGEIFANITTPWLSTADVVAGSDVALITWNGTALTPQIELAKITGSLPAGAQVGTAIISSGTNTASTPLMLKQDIYGPTWQWRLKRF
ncbi:MAG TPA: serine hydrolase, partial [Candidatus Saccharimonadales bacterium]|nr:serine hydrolase [Candidatus Saccharimonadales bacterium]